MSSGPILNASSLTSLDATQTNVVGRYHPDRNPAGREQFQAVAQAYERLQAGAAGGQGPQPWRLLLLLQVPAWQILHAPGATAIPR